MSTSFYQYQYCSLCRMNHKQRKKKHIYSKRHQEVLRNVIRKFQIKVADTKTFLSSPVVHRRGWEVDSQIWCYFCEAEIQKHKSEDNCVLVLGSFIKHLASADHASKTGDFFWQNIIPMDKKSDFTISGEEYNRFILLAEQVITGFHEKLEKEIKKEAANIVEADERSQTVRWMGMQEQLLKQSFDSMPCQARLKRQYSAQQWGEVAQGRKTVAAFSEGLTCIVRQEEEKDHDFHGNIFTGATPPWLREDEEKGSREIGPTMEDYKKNLEKQRRQKLPACRVGAKFDRTVDTSSEWLPSFGRVWNAGRRLNSRRQYLNEKRQARTATVTSDEIKSQDSGGVSQVRSQDLEANGHTEQCQGLSLAGQVGPYRCNINDRSLPLFTKSRDPIASLEHCNISLTPDGQLATAYAYCNSCKDSGPSFQPSTFVRTLNNSPSFLDDVASQSNLMDFAASSPVYVVPYKRRKESCISKVPPKFTNFIPIAASLLQTPERTNFIKKT